MSERTTRANGEASRRRILAAAAEIAGERGYAGTAISDVSARSGLPKSSIYWHFADKDALFAAVIEDSYEQWAAQYLSDTGGSTVSPADLLVRLHDSLASVPAFLRFGQLVVLERRDTELSARAKFLEIRRASLDRLAATFAERSGTDAATSATLAAIALALVDGAALARSADEHTLDDSTVLGDVLAAYLERVAPAR